MKRRLSDSDIWQSSHCSTRSVKRRKTSSADLGVPQATSPTPPHPTSHPLARPGQSVHSTQRPIHEEKQLSIRHWVEDCAAVCDSEMMAPPPTPRSAPSSDRGRRSTKRHVRLHGSRTPSPSKRPTPQTYRIQNMVQAAVFVDGLADLPTAIDGEVRRILGIETWEDYVPIAIDATQHVPGIDGIVSTFLAESRINARDCSLEGDWKASLNSVVKSLANLCPGVLKTHMSEKVWNSDLKPTPSSLDNSPDDAPRTTLTQTSLPDFRPNDAAAAFINPISSLPPHNQSAVSTTSTVAANPYYISTSKPDIVIGLADSAFVQQHQRRLLNHQATGSILSDPHAATMGIRFPFLVVEAKGLSLNGSLVSGQNQAAVSGACMLKILKDLDQAAWPTSSESDLGFHQLGVEAATTSSNLQSIPALCFSVVTEGPVHELWAHFEHEDAFQMEFLRSWRTTCKREAQGFVHFLARIMDWGRGRFKDAIVEKLNKVPNGGALA